MQESKERSGQRDRRKQNLEVSERESRNEDCDAANYCDSAGQTVEAVDEVECVGYANYPEEQDRYLNETGHRNADAVSERNSIDSGAKEIDHGGGEDLRQELYAR